MRSYQSWQINQVLIRQTLFGAPFLALSQFMGEQCYPIEVCLFTWSAAKVIESLISSNSNLYLRPAYVQT